MGFIICNKKTSFAVIMETLTADTKTKTIYRSDRSFFSQENPETELRYLDEWLSLLGLSTISGKLIDFVLYTLFSCKFGIFFYFETCGTFFTYSSQLENVPSATKCQGDIEQNTKHRLHGYISRSAFQFQRAMSLELLSTR